MQLYRLDPLLLMRGPRSSERRATLTDSVRLATTCRFASAAILASGQLVLMGLPGQGMRILPWPSEPHLRPVAMAFKPSGKRLLIVTAIGWLALVPVRELLATPTPEFNRLAKTLDEVIIGVPAPQRSDALSWMNHSKPALWKHGNISAVSWGPSPKRTALIFTADGSFIAVRVPKSDAPRLSETSPNVWCEEVLAIKLPRVVLSAVPLLGSDGFHVLIETPAPPPASGSVYYQLPLVPEGGTLKPGTPIPLSRPGSLISTQELRSSPVVVATDQQGKVNVWPLSRSRTPLYSYMLPPGAVSVLLAGRIIFAVYENKVAVISAHHAAAPAPSKPLQEISLPPGAKLLSASPVSHNCALLWTTQGAFVCSPHTPPRTLFFHLLADPRSRAAADALATALGLDLATLYEEAAERAMATGEAGLAVELYYESDVRPAKMVARYLAIRKPDVAISYLSAALRRPASLPISELRHMATVLLQCHAYAALVSHTTIGSAMPSPPDDACVAWAASSRDFDVGAALVMLRRAGLPRPFAAAARASSLVSRALSAAKGARLGRLLQALAEIDQVPHVQNTRLALLFSQPLTHQSIARLRLLLPRLSAADLAAARKSLLSSPLPGAIDALLDISLLCREERPALPATVTLPPSAAKRAAGAGNRSLASALYYKKGDVLASAAALFRPSPPPLTSILATVSSAPVETQAAVLLRAMKAGIATEAEISHNLSTVAPALLYLLRSNTPLPIKLSGRLCLRAIQARIRAPRNDATTVVSSARLWQAVVSNAAEEASAPPRGPITIPIYALPQGAGSEAAVAFSSSLNFIGRCGHVLSRRSLNEQLGARPPPVSPLFIGFYALRQIPTACPRCVAGLPTSK